MKAYFRIKERHSKRKFVIKTETEIEDGQIKIEN